MKSLSMNTEEVGLEAAILERKRNSSLVSDCGAEDPSRLKLCTEITDL